MFCTSVHPPYEKQRDEDGPALFAEEEMVEDFVSATGHNQVYGGAAGTPAELNIAHAKTNLTTVE